MVERIVGVLLLSPSSNTFLEVEEDADMETDDSEGLETDMELDDDMPLLQYQREIKIEAIARSGNSKAKSQQKKGKSPGLYGFTMDFYFFYWNIIGDHIFS